jgi:hypothetical protein
VCQARETIIAPTRASPVITPTGQQLPAGGGRSTQHCTALHCTALHCTARGPALLAALRAIPFLPPALMALMEHSTPM